MIPNMPSGSVRIYLRAPLVTQQIKVMELRDKEAGCAKIGSYSYVIDAGQQGNFRCDRSVLCVDPKPGTACACPLELGEYSIVNVKCDLINESDRALCSPVEQRQGPCCL
jgi:hypothetical protein